MNQTPATSGSPFPFLWAEAHLQAQHFPPAWLDICVAHCVLPAASSLAHSGVPGIT